MSKHTLGEIVGMRRRELHLTQDELADMVMLSRQQISLIERDRVKGLKCVSLFALADPLGLSVHDLFDAWMQSEWRRVS